MPAACILCQTLQTFSHTQTFGEHVATFGEHLATFDEHLVKIW
jgi:hypothetical protein